MGQKSGLAQVSAEQVVKEIRRATRRQLSAENIGIVLVGLRGEDSIAELCRREGIVLNLYYRWSKEFLEAGKKRSTGGGRASVLARHSCEGVAEASRSAQRDATALGSVGNSDLQNAPCRVTTYFNVTKMIFRSSQTVRVRT